LKHQDYNSKVDIFSLGVILFELIVPFGTEMERINKLKNLIFENKFPEGFQQHYTTEYNLISSLIEVNPKKRPSAKEVANSQYYNDFKTKYLTP
jgi:eukaryotic translation initiation factor 2-alpha kinase 3